MNSIFVGSQQKPNYPNFLNCLPSVEPHLRCISDDFELILPATSGWAAMVKVEETFAAYLDPRLASYLTLRESHATKAVRIGVHQQERDGRFVDLFAGVSRFFTPHQVFAFCEAHAVWLHPQGWATFLPVKVGNESFVAIVGNSPKMVLAGHLLPLAHDTLWKSKIRYRAVLPQPDTDT